MANTRKILLSLHTVVADKLAEEKAAGKNQSAIVDALVADHYGLTFEGDSKAAAERQSVLDSFKTGFVEDVPAAEVSEDTGNDLITEDVPVLSPITNEDSPEAASEPVEQDGGVAQPEVAPEEDAPVESQIIESPAVDENLVPVADAAQMDNLEAPVNDGFVRIDVPPEAPAPEAVSSSEADGTATLDVTPADPAPAAPLESPAPGLDLVEPLVSDPVPAETPAEPEVTVGDQPVPVQVTTPEPAPAEPTANTCPTCGEVQLTPICLNCL